MRKAIESFYQLIEYKVSKTVANIGKITDRDVRRFRSVVNAVPAETLEDCERLQDRRYSMERQRGDDIVGLQEVSGGISKLGEFHFQDQ